MDVRINEVTSEVRATDAEALLAPEVMAQVAEAVMKRMKEAQQRTRDLDELTRVDDRALALD